MAVNVTPLHDRVLIRRVEEKETVKGGIIIPDTAKEKSQEGEVIAVGSGKFEKGERIPLDVKSGDRVLFGKYSGTDIKNRRPGIPHPSRGRDPGQARRDRQGGVQQEVVFPRSAAVLNLRGEDRDRDIQTREEDEAPWQSKL